jgi:hypothetical protein
LGEGDDFVFAGELEFEAKPPRWKRRKGAPERDAREHGRQGHTPDGIEDFPEAEFDWTRVLQPPGGKKLDDRRSLDRMLVFIWRIAGVD